MNHDLLGFVLGQLRRREMLWTEVAKGSGVPYDTLRKIASGATPNPGVKHVQSLADFFDGLADVTLASADSEKKQAAALIHQSQVATNPVAQGVA